MDNPNGSAMSKYYLQTFVKANLPFDPLDFIHSRAVCIVDDPKRMDGLEFLSLRRHVCFSVEG